MVRRGNNAELAESGSGARPPPWPSSPRRVPTPEHQKLLENVPYRGRLAIVGWPPLGLPPLQLNQSGTMKTKIPTLLAASLIAGFAASDANADNRITSHGRAGYAARQTSNAPATPENRGDESVIALVVQKPERPRAVLRNHGRSGFHVRPDRRNPEVTGSDQRATTIALAIEKPRSPRLHLRSHGRAGYSIHRVND